MVFEIMSNAFYGNFEQFLYLDTLDRIFSHQLSDLILQEITILSSEIAGTLISMGFAALNLLLNIRQKFLLVSDLLK